jgi:hypothetical protein
MGHVMRVLIVAACVASAPVVAQQKPPASKPLAGVKTPPPEKPRAATVVTPGIPEASAPEDVTKIVQTWLDAWNRLDGSEAAIERFVDLYTPEARHDLGPSADLGPEFFFAPNGIRRLAEDLGRTHTELAYRLETATAAERAFELIYHTNGPWGGKAIAVPFTGAYTVRASKRRFFYPGVAVFHVNKAGKITYARFYTVRDQVAEVKP